MSWLEFKFQRIRIGSEAPHEYKNAEKFSTKKFIYAAILMTSFMIHLFWREKNENGSGEKKIPKKIVLVESIKKNVNNYFSNHENILN